MARKQHNLFSIIIVLSLSAGGMLFQSCRNSSQSELDSDNTNNATVVASNVADKISAGEKQLLSPPNDLQQTAAQAFANQNYEQAISLWSSNLQQQPNNPEILVYLNNARVGTKPAYKIAVPLPIDAETNVAKEILRGAAQAQTQINQNGGIKGKLLKIIVASDRNDPQTAKKLATSFVQNPDILGVVGHFSSNVTLEAAQVYQAQGLVTISPTSTSVALSNAGDYIFRTVSNDCLAANALVQYLTQKLQVKQTALLYNSASSYSNSLRDVFKSSLEAQGGEAVAEFNFNEPNFNIVSVLEEIKQQDAKALVLFPNSSGMNGLETLDKTFLIAQMNKGELPLLGGDSLYKPRTLQLGQENVAEMVLAVPWQTDNDSQFSQTAKKLWGSDVNWRTALTYDATMALAAAIEVDPTRSGVQQALLAPDFTGEGAAGEIKFLSTGDRAAQVELVKVVAGNSSGFGYDFVPVTDANYKAQNKCQ